MNDDDLRLLSHVHPPDWRNPTPAPKYDLVVIGGGTAGLVCAAGAAGLGARVALVEESLLGGDCLNTGCVPSKALLRSAKAVGDARAASTVGVSAEARPDFASAMRRLRARRADLAPNDSAARFARLGVDVFFGTAAFSGPRSVVVNGETLRFRKAVIATGSPPAVPPIPGLADVPFLTSENLFAIANQPRDLIVIGAGPVGCEMAQAFARLGTHVTLFESARQVLPREDPEAAALLANRLAADGVDVRVATRIAATRRDGDRIAIEHDDGRVVADAVLVAAGRSPRLDSLDLEKASVARGANGLIVDDRLRTTNDRIYAAGDVCSPYKFTHAADAMARIVVQNALFFGRRRMSSLVIPWCTFTDPEVAYVGVDVHEAVTPQSESITVRLADVDRAVIDESDGFVRVHHQAGRILGATIVAPHAGELIATIANAMRHGHRLGDFSAAIFPYPTLALALRQAGDAYRRRAVTPRVHTLLKYYFALLR